MAQDPSVKNGELVPGKSRNLSKSQELKLTQAEATEMQVMPCTSMDMDYYFQRERTHILSPQSAATGTLRGRDLPWPALVARDNTAKSKLLSCSHQRASLRTQAPQHRAGDSSMFEPTSRMGGTGITRLESQQPAQLSGPCTRAPIPVQIYSELPTAAIIVPPLIHRDSSHCKQRSAHSHSEEMAPVRPHPLAAAASVI